MAHQGLSSKECLRALYNQIDEVLTKFKIENLKANRFVSLFYKQNKYELVHNFLLILYALLSLILASYFKYLLFQKL